MDRKEKKPAAGDTFTEVLEYTEAADIIQAMESRGDFRYKGIFALFNVIHDYTNRFSTHGILPGAEQLARDTNLPEDRVKDYIRELLGLGNSKDRIIYALPIVDYVRSPSVGIVQLLVYCRPIRADGTSPIRYIHGYRDKNVLALQKWIDARPARKGMEYAEYLQQYIAKGRLPDSQAGAEISRFFYSELDTTPEKKKNTYTLFARPVIQRLIETGHLALLPEKTGSDSTVYRGVFYNKGEQMNERFKVLATFYSLHISTTKVSSDDLPAFEASLKQTLSQMSDSLETGHRQVIYELMLLAPKIQWIQKEETEKKKNESLEKFIEEVMKSNRIVDLSRVKNISDEIKLQVPSVSSIYYADFPLQGRVAQFVLHKNAVSAAIKQAKEIFQRTGDDTEYQVLIAMDIERHVDGDLLKSFKETEEEVLFTRLPWFVRMWRAMFGQTKLSPEENVKIKKDIAQRLSGEKVRVQTAEAKRAQKDLVSKRMKEKGGASSATATAGTGVETAGVNQEEEQTRSLERIQNEEKLKQIIVVLDKAWDEGVLPNRTLLIERFPEFNEDSLIMFLKKYARKEIFSIRIRHDKPEYVWPVLISRRYIRQKGKKLLSHYMHIADEQRNASMPNQEKFDVATSIEDFLSKILAKLSK